MGLYRACRGVSVSIATLQYRIIITNEQAEAELCQAQVKLEVVFEVGVEAEACHY